MFQRILSFLLLAAALASGEIRKLTILHINDLHAKLLPLENGRGGFAQLAAAIRSERAGCGHCILLNAGDVVQGSPVSTIFKGLPAYEIVNLFGIDASTLGNHDFDYGWRMAEKFVRAARFPMVSANLVDGAGRRMTKPGVILKTNGVRVAVIGAMTAALPSLSTPDLLGSWRVEPVLETLRRRAAEVKDRADLIVVLGHLVAAEEAEVLRALPEAAVIVSGHAHNGIPAPSRLDGRIMVRVRSYAQELGRLDLEVDLAQKKLATANWRVIPIGSAIAPAKDVAAKIAFWEAKVSKIVDVPIAKAARRLAQPDLKPILERAMAEETGADLAYMNPGGIRDAIPQGTVLARHVWNVMPFDNRVVTGRFKGSQLPAAVAKGRSLDPEREYVLAVTDFVAANQNEMGAQGLVFPKTGPVFRDALIEWIKKQKVLE